VEVKVWFVKPDKYGKIIGREVEFRFLENVKLFASDIMSSVTFTYPVSSVAMEVWVMRKLLGMEKSGMERSGKAKFDWGRLGIEISSNPVRFTLY
jgi:hypothetical protein